MIDWGRTKNRIVILLVLLAGGVSFAQEEQPVRKKDPLLLAPGDLVDHCRVELLFWPDPRGERAVRLIFSRGNETIPYLEKLLEENNYRIKPAVVHLLSRFGHDAVWEPARALINHPGLKPKVKLILDSLHRLRPDETLLLCTRLFSAKARYLRNVSFNFLMTKDISSLKEELEGLIGSPEGDVRRHAFLLLEKSNIPAAEMNSIALRLVGDENARLANQVRLYLSRQDSDKVSRELQKLVRSENERVFAFAVLTLVTAELKIAGEFVPLELAGRLDGYLLTRDPLLKVASASGLACIYLRRSAAEDWDYLRACVVPAYMEVFLAGRYCSDFSCLLEISAACLQKITGAPFGSDLTFWKTWWSEHGEEFVGRKDLFILSEEDLARVVIDFEKRGGSTGIRFRLAGDVLIGDPGFERTPLTCFVTSARLRDLLDGLYLGGFFSAADPAAASVGKTAASDGRTVLVKVTAGGKIRRVEYRERNTRFERIEQALLAAHSENAWQHLFSGGDFGSWYLENRIWWRDMANRTKQTERFLSGLIESFNLLSEETILACYDWLCERRDLGESLDAEEWRRLVSRVRNRKSADLLVRGMIDLVIVSESNELFDPLTTYLFAVYGEESYPLLGMVVLGMNRVADSAGDGRWYLRAGAACVLGGRGPGDFHLVRKLLDDESDAVRIEMLRSLAQAGTSENRAVLWDVIDRGAPARIRELMVALDGIKEPWVFEILAAGSGKESIDVRLAAVDALALYPGKEAEDLVFASFESFSRDSDEWRRAVDRLAERGGSTSRNVLLRLFRGNSSRDAIRFLALSLARLGETGVVPVLLRMLEGDEDSVNEIRGALSLLMVRDFPKEVWRYGVLWDKYPGRGQAFFLAEALGMDGSALSTGMDKPFEGIPIRALEDALIDERWMVRLAALRILEDGYGEFFGDANRDSTMMEWNRIREKIRSLRESRDLR